MTLNISSFAEFLRSTGLRFVRGTRFEYIARTVYTFFFQPIAFKIDLRTKRLLNTYLNSDSRCIDIGAYRGDILRIFLGHACPHNVYAFEPDPDNFLFLQSSFPDAIIVEKAASNSNHMHEFFRNAHRPARNSLKQSWVGHKRSCESTVVRCITLDSYFPPPFEIDIIKIDAEGSEREILEGATNLLKRSKPLVILEHQPYEGGLDSTDSERIFEILTQDCDLTIYDLLDPEIPLSRETFLHNIDAQRKYFFAKSK